MSSIYNTLQQNFIIIIERLLYSRKLLLQDDRVIIALDSHLDRKQWKELKSTAQKSSLYNYLHWHSGEKSLKKSHFSTFKIKLTIDELGAFKWQR